MFFCNKNCKNCRSINVANYVLHMKVTTEDTRATRRNNSLARAMRKIGRPRGKRVAGTLLFLLNMEVSLTRFIFVALCLFGPVFAAINLGQFRGMLSGLTTVQLYNICIYAQASWN